MKFELPVVVVTGAAMGIGADISAHLAALGYPVALVDRAEELASAKAAEIVAAGGQAEAFGADVADIESHADLVRRISAELDDPLVLINNAAVGGGEMFADVTPERYDAVFAVSAKGSFFLTQAMVPTMKRHGFGRIINVSSLLAARGERGNPHYAGAKAAMMGFTRSWAIELAPFGITSNTILPALTDTPMARSAFSADDLARRAAMVPAGRLATTKDLSDLIGFLISYRAIFMNGQTISPNGGEYVGSM